MNLLRIYLIAILLLAFGVGANGQEPPKAVLVDEHGLLPCDDTLSRLDAWYSQLNQNPNSIGLAVISGPHEEKHRSVYRQHLMEAHAMFRGASKVLKFKYIRANSSEGPEVQLWLIPPGSDEPEIRNIDMSYALPTETPPFMLGAEYLVGGSCPEGNDAQIFADFLKENPSARGNIVIRERSTVQANRKATRILRDFKRQYDISHSRLRFFPRKRSVPANYLEPIVEYWYLP